ncbi:MAG: NAD(P)-dependent oxidoreductase [Candidatus Eisenbacteria bacterium]|uniref:NAD(P)-dependent oxidoreductase n=1 Tax=Eiseniibacteriota bacterium TaxID=2212470 RepID=A0A948S1P8_UNCEI|nr:NAD(P)-dependent oxidoreductase [Candidatus Eisenbacteria bacterium]MBU1948591.1 NAD(P)-dependent oxidoreductase [Candidatus Eisenbacteria bacterium]MBU2693282.1 NAD(P)-dependent oxidoreductase [Candidatus Eisenbacteria bacterium]
MKILVTGNRGLAGAAIERALSGRNYDVAGFDRVGGKDIRDPKALSIAMRGCDAVIHAAALAGQPEAHPSEIIEVNLLGTWNVLWAAECEGVRRIVYLSSVNTLGCFIGEKAPDYLPIDDDYPCSPGTPYGVSKKLSEEMCKHFTARTGIPTICLRPPGIFNEARYLEIRKWMEVDPRNEWTPFWEYGAFIDVWDVARAALCALECPDPGHATFLLCAADIVSAEKTTRELVSQIHPGVPWRGGIEYKEDPYRSLICTERARKILGWEPVYSWRSGKPRK